MSIQFTNSNFRQEVLNSELPVIVDFWAVWCGPCKALGPTIEALSTELAGTVKVGKVNVDDEPALANQYRISSIPTVMLFKGGKPVGQAIGLMNKETLLKRLGL